MQKMIEKRKKLQEEEEEEKIFVEEIEKSIEVAMEEEDPRSFLVLETEKADQMVLLIKCPPRVAMAWRHLSSSFSSDFVPLAKCIDSVDLLSPDLSPELTMEMVGAEYWNISKLYSIIKSKDFIPTSIFSEANQGKVAVEGTVTYKLDMIPHCGIEEYGKLCRERNRNDRQIEVLDNCRGEHLTPKPAMVKKQKKPKRCVKRTRGDRSKVEAKLFQLFERQPKWTMKQLVQESNQPTQFLVEILKELCVYKRGGHTHELKPEYRKTVEEDTTFAQ